MKKIASVLSVLIFCLFGCCQHPLERMSEASVWTPTTEKPPLAEVLCGFREEDQPIEDTDILLNMGEICDPSVDEDDNQIQISIGGVAAEINDIASELITRPLTCNIDATSLEEVALLIPSPGKLIDVVQSRTQAEWLGSTSYLVCLVALIVIIENLVLCTALSLFLYWRWNRDPVKKNVNIM